jgi:hypothetical protein
VGDVDNDGDLDVYLANLGPDAFYRNRGDGTFENATERAGFRNRAWSVAAAFVDVDRDDDLDLFVVHYVDYDPDQKCTGLDGGPDYCNPLAYEGTLDALYRNDGHGTFTDVSAAAGITKPGRGLGVVCADFTGDGWVDIYVANDSEANHLWVNRGDGTFAEEAVLRGAAFNAQGEPEASMGVDAGDADGDGRLDLFMTHLVREKNTLYFASDGGLFGDRTVEAGLAQASLPFTGFGTGFFDYDHDGDLDLAVVNGGVGRGRVWPGAEWGAFWNPLAEPNLLFRNEGGGRFTDVSRSAEPFAGAVEVGRGLAFGDLDDDGDLDLVMGTLHGVRVFRNHAPPAGAHWLIVRPMIGVRDAIGAEVTVVAGGRRTLRLAHAASSYASSSDPRTHFGLGAANRIDRVEIRWPDDVRESFAVAGVDRVVTLWKGEGEPIR